MTEQEAMALAAAAKRRKQGAAAQMTAGDNRTQPQSFTGDTEAKRRKLRLLQDQARVRARTTQGQPAQDFSDADIQAMIDELERPSKQDIDRMLAELEGRSSAKGPSFGHRAKEFFLGDNDPNTQNLPLYER